MLYNDATFTAAPCAAALLKFRLTAKPALRGEAVRN